MIQYKNGGCRVEDLSELPDLRNARELFLDFETGSKDRISGGNKPYHGDRIAGVCITVDDSERSWYVPVRHFNSAKGLPHAANLPVENVMSWLNDIVRTADRWINHNVKFDAHFAAVDGVDAHKPVLVDTLTLAKILDSDRGFGGKTYGLDSLSADWLGENIAKYDGAVQQYLRAVKLHRNKKCGDYARVPPDILGEYGCQDVITNRRLWRWMQAKREEDQKRVWNTEIAVTGALFDMERIGMRVDMEALEVARQKLQLNCLKVEEAIHQQCGFVMQPHTNAGCYDLFCNHFGLPVLAYTDDGNPSFDFDALMSYMAHPGVVTNPRLMTILKLVMKHREMHTLLTVFVNKYLEVQVDGIMYPFYNQAVRTGRFSCKSPNMQQLSPEAKYFIIPPKGETFLSNDYSQIEFRIIVHYIKDPAAIAAYLENPDTDFHTWVAEMCQIPRKPAKNVNFAIAFAGGKKRILQMLASNMDLVGILAKQMETDLDGQDVSQEFKSAYFERLCRMRASEVFDQYHATLPGLAQMTKHTALVAEKRGWVKNLVGRRRHLPSRVSWRGFNSVVQSSIVTLGQLVTAALAALHFGASRIYVASARKRRHLEAIAAAVFRKQYSSRICSRCNTTKS
jgi:DNA polymerase-1